LRALGPLRLRAPSQPRNPSRELAGVFGAAGELGVLQGPLVYWYKQSTHWATGRQFTIRWDDPEWGFEWPITDPILSARDQRGAYVAAT
jgi:dTDP-4-dehydrorhamnose 3,5-epimerase-like enzyme